MTPVAVSIDELLTSSHFGQDPYPTYRRLLELDSPFRSEARGAWLVAHFDHVVGSLRDWEHFSSAGRVRTMLDHFSPPEWEQLSELARWSSLKGIIHSDPPDHPRLRGLLAKAFTRRVVEQLRPDVQRLVDELLDRVQDRREMDVVGDLAAVLPAAVISEMLGVPAEDRVKFLAWSDAALGLQGKRRASLEVALLAQDAYVSLQEYFAALIEDRRRRPRDGADEDLLTSLIRAGDQDDSIERADLIQSCITLMMGGFETTTSFISNTLVLLLQHSDVLERLRADATLMDSTIEESLRLETPIQTVTRRVAEDIPVGDALLREGDLAIIMMGAANRDPRQFDDPDRFDIERENRHVAFGFGIHFCLGAPLARLEAPIAVSSMLDRMPTLALAVDEISWNTVKTVVRCPTELPVTW
jgi:pimeloyl-[acyl-carrier protein] synthase